MVRLQLLVLYGRADDCLYSDVNVEFNPITGKWDGNEEILRNFDDIPTSTTARPALITHYTGGSSTLTSPNLAHVHAHASNTNSTIRIVGDMKFDPERMCWVSNLDEDEPDPFEGLADDEDDDPDPGATITRANARRLMDIPLGGLGDSGGGGGGWSSRLASESSASVSTNNSFGGWSERGGSAIGNEHVDEVLRKECFKADERHRGEMNGWWISSSVRRREGKREREERERMEREREGRRLWDIRKLATED
jgi:hypothetical protein